MEEQTTIKIKSNDPRDEEGKIGYAIRTTNTHYRVTWNISGRTTRVRADRIGTKRRSGYSIIE